MKPSTPSTSGAEDDSPQAPGIVSACQALQAMVIREPSTKAALWSEGALVAIAELLDSVDEKVAITHACETGLSILRHEHLFVQCFQASS